MAPYRHFTPFGLGTAINPPSRDEVLEIWTMSPWPNELSPDGLHDELSIPLSSRNINRKVVFVF